MKLAILIVFFVLAFLLILLFFPLVVSVRTYIDVIENVCCYEFRLVGIRVLCGRLWFGADGLVVENQKHRFQGKKNGSKIFALFGLVLFSRMDVVNADVVCECGVKDNPAVGAVVCGGVMAALGAVFCVLKAKNCDSSFGKRLEFWVCDTRLNFAVEGKVAMPLYAIVFSFLWARIEVLKSVQTKVK